MGWVSQGSLRKAGPHRVGWVSQESMTSGMCVVLGGEEVMIPGERTLAENLVTSHL